MTQRRTGVLVDSGPSRPTEKSSTEKKLLPLSVSIQLAAAWIQHVADIADVPVLFIKGVAAVSQGLRPRSSVSFGTDVDILVDPRHFERLVRVLASVGWRATHVDEVSVFTKHSVTLAHSSWPCYLDVHYYFPGLFADVPTSFEALENGSEHVQIAGHSIRVPSKAGHVLILAVNGARSPKSSSALCELERMAQLLRQDPTLWQEVLVLSAATRSGSVLRSFATQNGFELPPPDLSTEELRAWQLETASETGGVDSFIYRIQRVSNLSQLWRLVRWAVWHDGETLRLKHPELPGGMWGVVSGNLQRWGRSLHRVAQLMRSRFRDRDHALDQGDALHDASSRSGEWDAPEFGPSVQVPGVPLIRPAVILGGTQTSEVETVRHRNVTFSAESASSEPSQLLLHTMSQRPEALLTPTAAWVVENGLAYVLPGFGSSQQLQTPRALSLGGGALAVWEWLVDHSPQSLDQIESAMTERYADSAESDAEIRASVRDLVLTLTDVGAVGTDPGAK